VADRLVLVNLRPLRTSLHLSQPKLAELSGLTQTYISALENGVRPRAVAHIEALADALGVTAEALLGDHRIVIEQGDVRVETAR
jgi:transcriptional regulator with XRE-family HTH domain